MLHVDPPITVRPPAVAGSFYPGNPVALRDQVQAFVHEGQRRLPPGLGLPVAILAPHAGFLYSGPIAGTAFAAARGRKPGRVVVVGPAHRLAFRGISAGGYSAWRLPEGAARVDEIALAELEALGMVDTACEAHQSEHSVEVILPFVRVVLGDVPILPLLVGSTTPDEVEAVLEVALRPNDLLVLSSDLSHYLPADVARRRDLATLERVLKGQWELLGPHDACGALALAGAVRLARRRGWRPTLLDYRNSGDTAGSREQVVGYAALAWA